MITKTKAIKLLKTSLAYIGNLGKKKVLVAVLKEVKITWEDLIENEYFITTFTLLEKQTNTKWKIIKYHEYEILGGNIIPATVIVQKVVDKKIITFAFSDNEYLDIFFKRFDIILNDDIGSGEKEKKTSGEKIKYRLFGEQ